ncbi:hypothetical protein CRG98_016214 [Punica granatum]|uniref:Uncharacterized protein n=1 Tax=Punica granatum TaxID=22663 RepID=A0A2I0K6Q7_PUNGR|nr:hypothetical protein CRG98_016214 [Punica granatum]
MNSNPSFGRESSCREPVGQNGVLTTMKQVLDCLSGLILVSRVSLDPGKGLFQTGSNAQSSFDGKLMSEFCTTHSLQFLDLGKSLHLGPSESIRSPEGHFNGHERPSASLRGMFLTNRGHNGLQTPRNIRKTLRKPWSRIPRSAPTIGLQTRTTGQRSHTGQKAHRDEQYSAQGSN